MHTYVSSSRIEICQKFSLISHPVRKAYFQFDRLIRAAPPKNFAFVSKFKKSPQKIEPFSNPSSRPSLLAHFKRPNYHNLRIANCPFWCAFFSTLLFLIFEFQNAIISHTLPLRQSSKVHKNLLKINYKRCDEKKIIPPGKQGARGQEK